MFDKVLKKHNLGLNRNRNVLTPNLTKNKMDEISQGAIGG